MEEFSPSARALSWILWVLAAPAMAYELKLDSTGTPVRWAEGLVTYVVDARGGPDVPGAAFREAVERCLGVWAGVRTAAIRFVPRAPLPASSIGYDMRDGAKNENSIAFEHQNWPFDPSAVAVTVATYRVATHEIIDADVLFNGQHMRWARYGDGSEPPERAYDFENVATHELGHVLGLAHNGDEPDATMYPRARPAETSKRTLDADDASGISHLYPLSERSGFMPPRGKVEQPPPLPREEGGCASSGPRGLALALLALMLARRSRRRSARTRRGGLLFVAALAAHGGGARAATFMPTSLEELAARATLIVRARTLAREDAWRGTLIYATTTASTLECIKGACPATLLVRQPGGEVGGIGQIVSGSTPLEPGREVVLFLERDPGAPGVWRTVGMDQGVFGVAREAMNPTVARPVGEVRPATGTAAAILNLGELRAAALLAR